MSDDKLERKVINQLDENGFEGLFAYLLNQDDFFCNAQKLDNLKGCIYERAAERFIQSTDVFFYLIMYTRYIENSILISLIWIVLRNRFYHIFRKKIKIYGCQLME